MSANPILDTTKYVVDNSDYVKINQDKIDNFCNNYSHINIKHWLEESPFDLSQLSDDNKLNFLLLFNSLSFSYWGNPKWAIEYNGQQYDGSWGMIASLGKAIMQDRKILEVNNLIKLERSELADILRGNTEIPLFDERYQILKEVSEVLNDKYSEEFKNLVLVADRDATKLLNIIISNFPSFKDKSIYKGKEVLFYKRAQLLIADIYQLFKGKGYGDLEGIENLTACADYKLPMILREIGILSYSDKLADKIDKQIELEKDSQEENEIRANTIWATEYIKRGLLDKISDVNSIHINDHIWLLSQNKSSASKPYHRVRTICY